MRVISEALKRARINYAKWFFSMWYTERGISPPWVYRLLSKITAFYIRHQPPFNQMAYAVPVVVVGNITVGGTGKTPFVMALVKHLQNMGWHPGVICRGDGGRQALLPRKISQFIPEYGDVSTCALQNSWQQYGDEARLHASLGVPVWEGVRRHEVAQALLHHHPEVDVIVSDDGLQHRALFRTVECVLVSATLGLGNGYLLPAGPLRESVARLNQVDAVIFHKATPIAPDAIENVTGFSSFEFSRQVPYFWTTLTVGFPIRLASYLGLRHKQTNLAEEVAMMISFSWKEWGEKSHHSHIVAVSAIASPENFFEQLHNKGVHLSQTRVFPDHYQFEKEDFSGEIEAFLITEKDAVKCVNYIDLPIWVVPAWVEIPEDFLLLLSQRLLPFRKGDRHEC